MLPWKEVPLPLSRPCRFYYGSDYHLEKYSQEPQDQQYHQLLGLNREESHLRARSVFLLVGDLADTELVPGRMRRFLEIASQAFACVVYLPGNHEYYSREKSLSEMTAALESVVAGLDNVYLAVDVPVFFPSLRLLLAAYLLWSSPLFPDQESYNPRLWQTSGVPVSRAQAATAFQLSKERILAWARVAQAIDCQVIVATHYGPNQEFSLAPVHRFQENSDRYASDVFDLLSIAPQISVWFYGHTGFNFRGWPKKEIPTLFLSNQFEVSPQETGSQPFVASLFWQCPAI